MNFALYMLGQAVTPNQGVVLRPTAVERRLRNAALQAAAGNIDAAADVYEQLVGDRQDVVGPRLVLAQLRHMTGNHSLAAEAFDGAIETLLGEGTAEEETGSDQEEAKPAESSLNRMVAIADRDLRSGHYVRAIRTLHQGMETVETLLAANLGLIVSDARAGGNKSPKMAEPLVGLAVFGDVLLRLFARANLASNLAQSLEKRRLRSDLAVWASGGNVDKLLTKQYEQLKGEAKTHRSHIDLHYRMGFVARALGKLEEAAEAFSQVLKLHPHHLVAAAMFAATNLQLGRTEAVMPVLAVALAVSQETLARYQKIAEAATDIAAFDRIVEALVAGSGSPAMEGKAIRANLALALSEMGLMDQAHAPWRNPLAVVPQS